MSTARRVTRRRPVRFTTVKPATRSAARSFTGIIGKYHWFSAEADSKAVSPHVGTQPHQ